MSRVQNRISIDEFKALQKSTKRKRSNYREADVQKEFCKYVRLKYPTALFNCDCSGLNLSKTQSGQAKAMRSHKGYPDFMLYEPRACYHGLFIEFKAEGVKLIKANGQWASDHIKEQVNVIQLLRSKGYYADIRVGLDSAIEFIDEYMNLKNSALE